MDVKAKFGRSDQYTGNMPLLDVNIKQNSCLDII